MLSTILAILLTLTGFLLMFIILLQRGRGGGLAGALGGMGGQSAFGTKAGDVFTKITVGMAVVWVVLSGVTGMAMFSDSQGRYSNEKAKSQAEVSATDDAEQPPAGAQFLPKDMINSPDTAADKDALDENNSDEKKPPAEKDDSPESDPTE